MKQKINEKYTEQFLEAITFTKEQGLRAEVSGKSGSYSEVARIALDLSNNLLSEVLHVYQESGVQNVIATFGADCGNVHLFVLNYIRENYPNVDAQLTIGSLEIDEKRPFSFDRKMCIDLIERNTSKKIDFHTWITIGDDYILDCTVCTYINNYINETRGFGGIFWGMEGGEVRIIPTFHELGYQSTQTNVSIFHVPIILGLEALHKLAPKHK